MLVLMFEDLVKFRRLLDITSGLVFLGCPHISLGGTESKAIKLLRFVTRLPKVVLAQAELNISVVANLCQQFEHRVGLMTVPVISAYETLESHLKSNLLVTQRSVVSKFTTVHACCIVTERGSWLILNSPLHVLAVKL